MSYDPSQNFIASYPNPLDAIFLPKSIAVIGAKDDVGTVGRTLLANLLSGTFQGKVYPVNPKREEVLGIKCYKRIADIPELIDLAIIVTPAATVPALIQECNRATVKGVIIISAGFKELGQEGAKLEKELLGTPIRIIGPNCLGIMNPTIGLNASFAKEGMALRGNIAFISQSGAMCTAVLDWSFSERIGFSAFVSVGSMIDVDWGDLIRYFGSDPNTESILIYMETVGNARSFLSAAKEIALDKPIIIIKPGRSQEAATAAASHTGSLTGSDEVFDAALERVGVLRVNSISQLFHMSRALGKQPRPKGPRLHIVTNAGGPAVLATDATVLNGAEIAPLSPSTKEKLDQFLPPAWSHANPIDILGDADADRYQKTLEVVSKEADSDGILVILSPQDMTDPIGTAEVMRSYAQMKKKPLLASWMGGSFVKGGVELLNAANIPTFEYPDDAAWSFATMCKYSETLESLYQTPLLNTPEVGHDIAKAETILKKVQDEKRTLLSEYESKLLLTCFGIPTVPTSLAYSADEAIQVAESIGFPVVLKLYSHTITHKSDIGGVKLNLSNSAAVNIAYKEIQEAAKEHFQGVTVQPMIARSGVELILGSNCDPQFGPVLLFGAGGVMVEIFRDHAVGLPPLNDTLARRQMAKTKIYHALQGFRGKKAVSLDELSKILVSFSQMIASLPWIKECDINPLVASHEAIIALDARVVLHEKLPLPTLAIRPYPTEYIHTSRLKNGQEITIRPIRPEDEPAMISFHKELSEKSVRQRYFEFKTVESRTAHNRLVRICSNDFDQQIALVAVNGKEIFGVARLIRLPGTSTSDLKLIIKDAYHGQGLATLFLQELIKIAKREGLSEIIAQILSENGGMLHLMKKFGFTLSEKNAFSEAILKL